MLKRKVLAFPLLFLILGPAVIARADCAAPSSPGLHICFPSSGSTVMYVAGIEMAATTASGGIARVEVWDNGTKRDNFPYLPATLFDGSMKNGWNRVTVKVWDTDGNLYQAQRSFYVTGYGVGKCATPSTAGINLCWPAANSWQPNNEVPISATAKGQNSTINDVTIYVDGKLVAGRSANYIVTGAGVNAGPHKVTARAVDNAGHTFEASSLFHTYYNYDCNPRTGACSPGIVINEPSTQDVSTTFTMQADVQENPAPISKMQVYIDGVAKATSGGPGITTSLTLPANSTHRMVVKAWDTSGKTYESYQNLYVQ